MFGFGKKKNEEVPSNLKDLKKDSLEIHRGLQVKVKEYLLAEETIITDGRLGFDSYFITDRRIISIQAMNKKLKGVQVGSIYYSNVESVTYSEGTMKKLNYDIITINLKGSIKKELIQLPREVTKEIYNIINGYITNNGVSN
ncbi:MAG: PH domain-containing protein [Peptostreptococcaceae bacterium]